MNNNAVNLGRQIQQGKKRTYSTQIDLSHIDPEYVGQFVFHYPSLMELVQIGVIRVQMLKGVPDNSVDFITDNIAHMSATLSVVLDSHPNWFNLDELYDYEVLSGVYQEYAQWRDSFRRPTEGNADSGNSQGTGN